MRCGHRRLQLSVRPHRAPAALFRCGGRLHFSHRRGPQPAGPGQSHVLSTVLQEQPDRCQTGHRQRKKRTENCVDKGRQRLSGSAPGGNEAGPRRGPSTTEPPTEDLAQQTSLLDTEPAEAAFPLPEPLLARDGTVFCKSFRRSCSDCCSTCRPPAGLAGGQPGGRCPRPAAGALLCVAGYHPGSRAVRRAFCHPADSPGQRAGMGAALP